MEQEPKIEQSQEDKNRKIISELNDIEGIAAGLIIENEATSIKRNALIEKIISLKAKIKEDSR